MTPDELMARWDSLAAIERQHGLRRVSKVVRSGEPNPYATSMTLRIAWRAGGPDRVRLVAAYGHPADFPGGEAVCYREETPEEHDDE